MKKILSFCLLGISFGFAQDPMSSSPPPLEPSPLPSAPLPPPLEPSPMPLAPEAKPANPPPFDAVRGHAYNLLGITGAPSTVYDLVLTPNDIYGKKFFYVAPVDQMGYAAFNLFNGSGLLGFETNFGGSSDLILGYATSAFGLALRYSIDKTWISDKENPLPGISYTNSSRVTGPGDDIELHFSLPIGSSTAYASAGWRTYYESYYMETEGVPEPMTALNYWEKMDYSTIDVKAGILGAIGTLNYDASLNIQRSGGTLTSDRQDFSSMGDKLVTYDSYLGTALNFNVSYLALRNETSRVLIGANNALIVWFLDKVDTEPEYAGDNIINLRFAPNILGEVVVVDNWLAFVGATHRLYFQFGDGSRDEDHSVTYIKQTRTFAFLGVRYQKNNWALEAEVSNSNPFTAFVGDNPFVSLGGFIYF